MTTLRAALIIHLVNTAWLIVNGAAHTTQVLWKARAGTLKHGLADLHGLLAVGAGLLLAGAAYTYSAGGLMRAGTSLLWPAFLAAMVLAAVVAAMARRYGYMFLGGTITLGLLHLGLLTVAAMKLRAG